MAVHDNDLPHIYEVHYTLNEGICERSIEEVYMDRHQACEMEEELRGRGAEEIVVEEKRRYPPLTFEEALTFIRRDF